VVAHSVRNASGRDLKGQNTTKRFLDVALNIHVVEARVEVSSTLLIGGTILVNDNAIDFDGGILQALVLEMRGPHVNSQVQRTSVSSPISKTQAINSPSHGCRIVTTT
jgi:hypothetical protein